MLQGSLDTVSFDEVLGFLASSSKTGVLRISGDRGTGSVWVTDGQMVAAETTHGAADSSIDEVVFEMLRFNSGTFAFDFDEISPNPGSPIAIDNVLGQANKLLVEWRRIEEIIPSLDHLVIPVPRLPADQVTITEDEWATLLAIGAGATAEQIAASLELGQLEGLRRIKGLVERKLVLVTDNHSGLSQTKAAAEPKSTPAKDEADTSSPASTEAPSAADEAASSPSGDTAGSSPSASKPSAEANQPSEPLGFEAPTPAGSAAATPAVPPPVAPSARRLSARRAEVEPTPAPQQPAGSVFESAIPAPPPAPAPRTKVDDNLDDPFAADESRPPMPPPPPPSPTSSEGADSPVGADVPPPPAPPSPAEIAKFGTSVEDASSISESGEDDSEGEASLLMRYLQSEG